MKKILTLFFLLLIVAAKITQADVHPVNAVLPTYQLTLKNDTQLTSKSYRFEVWISSVSSNRILDLRSFQCGIGYNTAIINGGSISATLNYTGSVLLAFSDMYPQPFNVATAGLIKLATKPGATSSHIVIPSTGVQYKLVTITLTNTVDFALVKPNLTWLFSTAPYPTKVFAYLNSAFDSTQFLITLPSGNPGNTIKSWHSTNQLTNPCLNCFQSFTVSGGGNYCSGANPTGINVILNGSEIGFNYQLLKNGINEGVSVQGTGNALIWNNLSEGNYSVSATNGIFTSQMNGYADINEISLPATPIISVQNNCNNSILTAQNFTGSLHWSTGDTTQQITVNTAGNYTVNQTVNGCMSPNVTATAVFNNQPQYFCELRNDEQTSANTYEFDIYLLNDNECVPLEYASGAFGITINPAVRNGGNITAAIIPGSSELNSSQIPTGITFTSSQNCIKIAARTTPTPGSGTIIPTSGSGKKVCRVRITNNVAFAYSTPDLTWSFTATPYQSKVNAFLNGINTLLVADTNTHTTHHLINQAFAPLLAPTTLSVNHNNFCKKDTTTITLTASGGSGNYLKWYKDSCNGLWVGTGISITIAAPDSTTTYFARWEMGSSFTSCASITVISTLTPGIPTVNTIDTCGYSRFQADNYSGNLYWSTGETAQQINVLNQGQYYVNQSKNGCTSDNAYIMANPKIVPPSLINYYQLNNLCGFSTILITGNTGSLHWSTNDTTNLLTVINTGVYSVTQTQNGCSSPVSDIYADPKIIPSKPLVSVENLCGNSNLTISNPQGYIYWSTGSYGWYGPNPLNTEQGSYWVYQQINGCNSDTTFITSNPKPIPPAPQIAVSDTCGYSKLTASAYTGSLQWNNNDTNASITISYYNYGYYYVNQTVNGCVSPNASAYAYPKYIPPPPNVYVSNTCDSSYLYISTWPNYYGDIIWSTGATSTSIYVYDTNYYTVTQASNGCRSEAAVVLSEPIPSLITAVSIMENTNHLCAGSSVKLTATPHNGGSSPYYYWYKNNQMVYSNPDSTYTFSAMQSDNIYCRMNSSLGGCISSPYANSDTITIIVDNPPKYSHIKLYLEGFYSKDYHQMTPAMNDTATQFSENITDTITLQLAQPYFPYLIDYTFGAMLQTNGRVAFDVPCSITGHYFLVAKQRNHIETWSAIPILFGGDTVYYNFTDAAGKASGDNQKEMETNVFAFYTGDVNQDGLVDGSDMSEVEYANNSFYLGYLSLDVNGDGLVDGSDMSLTEYNNNAFVYVAQPFTTTATLVTDSINSYSGTNASISANVLYDGGALVSERGICYSTSPNPTTANTKIISGSGMGTFAVNLSGLNYFTTYYVRSYATNSIGTAYSNEVSFKTHIAPVYDIDGNGYDTVKIGNQTWLKSNLKATKYRNGDTIPNITEFYLWSSLFTGAYCNYNNDTLIGKEYGRLYNWYTVNDSRNLCPIGWHVPSDTEWTILTNYLGGESIAGGKLKEAGTIHWQNNTNDATNESGFTALPGGFRYSNDFYPYIGFHGLWWSINTYSQYKAILRQLSFYSNNIFYDYQDFTNGLSVRCLKGDFATIKTDSISGITQTSAISGGNITSDGGLAITSRGICWSTSPNPTITSNKTIDGSGTGSFTSNISGLTAGTTYYVRAYATNSLGTAYGNEVSFTTTPIFKVYDIDGYAYDTVQIGTQVWMKQNLKTTHYKNGAAITYPGTDNAAWQNNTTGAYAWHNNDETTYKNTYGALYNWYAVNTGNLCPTGWHVPSDAEWTTLTTYLGGASIAGGKLKATTLWDSPNTGATNSSGFAALPGGYRFNYGPYTTIGDSGCWWSSTQNNTTNASGRLMYYNNKRADMGSNNKLNGLSVRCLKGDLATLTTDTISGITQTSAISGGNITSDGGLAITARGICWSTSPNPTITLTTKTTDGSGTGSFTSNISGLTAGTTYFVRAYATNSVGTAYGNEINFTNSTYIYPVYDIDGNGYDTVKIGTQVWLKQNLKTTKYSDGSVLPNVTDNADWAALTTGAYCNYNNDINIANTYGRLYNWYTVNDFRNICPTGWHVPSDIEWTTLTTYLGGESIAGGKLKEAGLAHWTSPNTGAVNEYNFTAIASGEKIGSFNPIDYVSFGNIDSITGFWSSSNINSDNSWIRLLHFNTINVQKLNYSNRYGFSIRCLRNMSAQASIPTINTTTVTSITFTTATLGGNINSDGGSAITVSGVCWSTSPNPSIALSTKTTDGSGTGSFTSNITGLTAGTTYYVRAYATNSAGTAYGNEMSFTTTPIFKVYDIDGNAYDTVKIGTQVWLKQNLKTTKYRNGDAIPNVTVNGVWGALTTGAYCNYNNVSGNSATYGRLYNWFTVNTSNLCPLGWHVPTDAEWTTLTTHLGGESIAGGKLKEAGLANWNSPNTAATNETSFTALPGGGRGNDGTYYAIGYGGYWWSSTETNTANAWTKVMGFGSSSANRLNDDKKYGFSVRCLRD